MSGALARLRARARATALFPACGLGEAMARMGFVQADPIRAPARAQDLILRHRVKGYRAGDLDRAYARLGLEEDFLYAYGFMPGPVRALLHPRPGPAGAVYAPEGLAAAVLAAVRRGGIVHPRDLEAEFGRDRTVNGWGGFSKATTQALDALRHHGLVRVAGRRDGIRVYEAAEAVAGPVAGRAEALVLLVAGLLAPVSPVGLGGALGLMVRRNPGLGAPGPVVAGLVRSGALESTVVEGETYLWPAGGAAGEPRRDVRLLAPFDPLVWDRRRFLHLWGWEYRFEAYTPPARRRLGYYAMPLLWGDAVIGWANVRVAGGRAVVEPGFACRAPRAAAFWRALEAEVARFERFMGGPTAS